MLQIVDGKLMNSHQVGNAVAQLLLSGTPIDKICEIEGMPTPTQIAFMRKNDHLFAEALQVAFEGAGIEAAMVLMAGARTGAIGKNQGDAARWVAERMAPDLFQERKTITNQEIKLSDEELAFQLQAAARTDERVRKILQEQTIDIEATSTPERTPEQADPEEAGRGEPDSKPERAKRAFRELARRTVPNRGLGNGGWGGRGWGDDQP